MNANAFTRWSITEEIELLNCGNHIEIRAYAETRGRPYTACLTKRSALLNGRKDKTGWQKMQEEPITGIDRHPQRSEAWRKADEAFVRALIAEAVRLGLRTLPAGYECQI
jgi:hypothetical protein